MKYRKSSDSKPVPVWLDAQLQQRISDTSERMGEPKSTVMRISMRIGLDSLEKAFEPSLKKLSDSTYPAHQPQGVEMNEPAPKKKKAA